MKKFMALACALLVAGACTTVDETEWCAKTRYGKVVDEGISPGIVGTFLVYDVTCFDMTERTLPENGVEVVEAQTSDPLTVEGDVVVKVALRDEHMPQVFRDKRRESAVEREIQDAVRSGYRDAIAGWSVNEIFSSRRGELSDSIGVKIQDKLGQMATVVEVYVRDIRAPQQIENARIAAAEQENRFIEAQRRSQIDSVNAFVRVINAEAEAQARRLEAEAYASNPALLTLRATEALSEGLGKACTGVSTCILGGDVMDRFLAGGLPGGR